MRVALGTAVLLVCAAGATGAYAVGEQGVYQPNPDADGSRVGAPCLFSLDGQVWLTAAQVRDRDLAAGAGNRVRVGVRSDGSGTCTVSLASYGAQGATWETSGKQVFQDFATVSPTPGATGSLEITVPGPGCFAQIDLYRGNVKHDGTTAALPEGPDHPVFTGELIAAWHGGAHTCTATASPSPTRPVSTPPAPPSASTSSSVAGPAPSASVSVPAPSSSAGTSLAQTGGGDTAALLGAGGVALLAAGGTVLALTRRQARKR